MTATLRVVAPGLHTTVQDVGRIGHQRFGIPVSGALDPVAMAAANLVVGNPRTTGVLEALYQGPTLEVAAECVRVAVAGLGAGLEIAGATPDEPVRRVPALQSVRVPRGGRIKVMLGSGAISAVLAVEGGLDVPLVLGSQSTYVRGGFGGLGGRALKAGDEIALKKADVGVRAEQRLSGLDFIPSRRVRVVLGPQEDYFTAAGLSTFLESAYRVAPAADRMGLRLEGPVIAHAKGYNIVSDGIAPGAIQVPGNGLPIILLADRQTTGGYPKIASVISADLPGLGRVGPGAEITFEAVSVEAAEAARRALEAEIAGWAARLEAVPDAVSVDETKLHGTNLVSGVLHAEAPESWHP